MRVPIINTDPEVLRVVSETFRSLGTPGGSGRSAHEQPFEPVPIGTHDQAIDYINYQMPALICINFSDPVLDGFGVMQRMVTDPWLNNGGVLALTRDAETYRRVDELRDSNILISLFHGDLKSHLRTVLEVVAANQQILIQRAIQSDLISTISGQFTLGMDLRLVPCYANLIANYLHSMGFTDNEAKVRVTLALTEMLTNAIEHGNCGITAQQKTEYLEAHGNILGLIAQKCLDPEIARRTVFFSYEIEREHSRFVIRDQGQGFNWREYLCPTRESDPLSLHGRGVALAAQSVARVEFNEEGNEARLRVQHRRPVSNTIPTVFQDNEVVEVQAQQVVFRQGEESSFLYYVAEGEYRVVVAQRVVATIRPEDVLMGEMSFLLEETRSATVIANTPGRLIKITKESFINGIRAQPYYGLFLAKLLARRLDQRNRV
jgi:anti-sigma regulatory factor (Ser/Thr protein kinase)/CheY-like chemotaxis protein